MISQIQSSDIYDLHGSSLQSHLFQAYNAYPEWNGAEVPKALIIQNAQKNANKLVISYNANGCGQKAMKIMQMYTAMQELLG